MKRIVAFMAAVVLLAACSSGATQVAPASAVTAAPVELTFLADVTNQVTAPLWQGLLDKFHATYPNITVTLVPTDSGARETRAKTLLATGDFPDVQLSLPSPTFKDVLLPFDLSDPEISGQLQNINDLTVGGKLYSLGIEAGIWNSIFYNKADFQKAGITTLPTTYPEFDAVLAKLKAAGITPLLGGGEWLPSFEFMVLNDIFAETPCWGALREQGKVHFTDQEWVDAATRFEGYVQKGYFNQDPLGMGYLQTFDYFLQDGAPAMFPFGSSYASTVASTPHDFDVGIFPAPTRDGKLKLVGSLGAVGYSVSKTSKHPAEAVLFAKWMAFNPDPLTVVLNAIGNTPNIKLKSGPLTGLKTTPLVQASIDIMNNAVSFNTGWNGQGDCSMRPGVQDAIGTMLAQPLYLNPTQPVLPLLQKLDAFWDSAKAP